MKNIIAILLLTSTLNIQAQELNIESSTFSETALSNTTLTLAIIESEVTDTAQISFEDVNGNVLFTGTIREIIITVAKDDNQSSDPVTFGPTTGEPVLICITENISEFTNINGLVTIFTNNCKIKTN